MAKLARLEREASSCNDGCKSSFIRGKDPWVGCSESAGYYSVFSATCKDTLTHRDYAQCVETKMFLGWDRQRSWWYCTGMLAGGKFRAPHRIETGSALESRLNSGQLNHVSFVFGQPDRNVVAANTIWIQGSIPPTRAQPKSVSGQNRKAQCEHMFSPRVWTAPSWQGLFSRRRLVGAAVCSAFRRGSHDRWP